MLIYNNIHFPGTNKIVARKDLCKVKSAVHLGELIITLHLQEGIVIKSTGFGVRLLGFGMWSASY